MKPTSKEVIDELCKILNATPKEIKGFMTPKEKAKELVEKMENDFQYFASREIAIQHALIAVDEILEMDLPILEEDADKFYDYWEEVKQEIQKL